MKQPILHQILVGARAGDAITDQAVTLRLWLQEMGYNSQIYAQHIHASMQTVVRPFHQYRPKQGENRLIFHHSIGDPLVEQLVALSPRLILIYHNITPARFFAGIDPAWVHRAQQGLQQLQLLQPRTDLALAVSEYNAQDLQAAHFAPIAILPLPLDETAYNLPTNQPLADQLRQLGKPLLLFVGRIAPNKRQEDLLKLLYFLRPIYPHAQLALVGDLWTVGYDRFLRQMADQLGISDGLHLAGHLAQAEMVTYYRSADLFVSMSEHEGFGKPLIESMYLGLPVMAYAAGAVPATLGGAGILFQQKHYPALAELIHLLLGDDGWQQRIIQQQKERVSAFLAPTIRQKWQNLLSQLS